MRRIRITEDYVKLANEYSGELYPSDRSAPLKGEKKKNIKPIQRLKKFSSNVAKGKYCIKVGQTVCNDDQRKKIAEFIDKIIEYAEEKHWQNNLFSMLPSHYLNVIQDLNKILDFKLADISIKVKKIKPLSTVICEKMQYKEIRQHIMPKYIRKMGIKTCCYCNANYTITDEDNIGYYQLDHWKPKSKYPFLCISFFNLQPCCASCNQHKGNDDEGSYFNLYAEEPMPLDVFRFSLPEKNKCLYMLDHNPIHLKTEWCAIDKNKDTMVKDMEEHLHISNIYEEHCDVVEELLWKQIFYKDAFLDAFNQSKLGITLMENDINRLIIGTYSKPEDIHKRPLTKMRQDIARQLEIIKD